VHENLLGRDFRRSAVKGPAFAFALAVALAVAFALAVALAFAFAVAVALAFLSVIPRRESAFCRTPRNTTPSEGSPVWSALQARGNPR